MPYRVDISHAGEDDFDELVRLGALDADVTDGTLSAILPDHVTPADLSRALGQARVAVSPALGRDDNSVWMLEPRAVRVGSWVIAPDGLGVPPRALKLTDSGAFGTGLHPTTALCLELLDEHLAGKPPGRVLDVGTGSGILALATLLAGVPRALGVDTDVAAIEAARENARLNGLVERLDLVVGGPDAVEGAWPLVVANVLAAPLIEMAPVLVRRVDRGGRLVLSGIPWSVADDVERTYRRLGMRHVRSATRSGWTALVLHASW